MWLGQLVWPWLGVSLVGTALWTLGAGRSRRWLYLAGAAVLWLSLGIASGVQYRLHIVSTDWEGLQLGIEESSADALGEALDNLLNQGERAAEGAAEAGGRLESSRRLFTSLEQVHRSSGVSAVALFDSTGTAVAWAGEHRGQIPEQVRLGRTAYVYEEGPLYSYLYFVRPLESGATTVAAFLLESKVGSRERLQPFADEFERRYGTLPQFWTPAQARGDAVWDWVTDVPILSVSFAELTQQHWWDRVVRSGRLWTGLACGIALLLLSFSWFRSRTEDSGVPVLVGTVALLLAPMDEITAASDLFSPLNFVLPGPFDVTLGVLCILLLGATLWVLTHASRFRTRRLPFGLAAALATIAFPAGLELTIGSAAEGLMTRTPVGGAPMLLASVLVIALPLFLLFRLARPLPGFSPVVRAVALVLPGALATGVLLLSASGAPSLFLAAFWGIPTAMLLATAPARSELPWAFRDWVIAAFLAGSASLAFLWPVHTEATLAASEQEIARLGTDTDPFLDFLLRQFAARAEALSGEGEDGVNLLYDSWVASGLAREGYEARITLWRDGEVDAELNLSQLERLPASAEIQAVAARSLPTVMHYGGVDGLHYFLAAPLNGGRSISVAVPPRTRASAPTPLARVLDAERASATLPDRSLVLVPVDSGTLSADHLALPRADTVQWVRTESGWRSETLVRMPEGMVHAHLEVTVPPLPLLVTRAILLQALILAGLGVLWFFARLVCGELAGVPRGVTRWAQSFRGRVSISLFAFFLLPTLVFGVASYGAVTREVVRSAAALAQQILDQAANSPSPSSLAESGSISNDLLLYRRGALEAATASEVIDLGLFPTWLSPDVFLGLAGGGNVQELEERRLGQTDYLVAYRRIDPASVLAAPIPLASNEIARRQQQFRDVALLVTLMGFVLSIVLSLLVGRALSRPIDELSRATRNVGAGDLRTLLPESRTDEFGSVFSSFNRMVARLRQTRSALVQETRRTETIVAEAATGVLALDEEGRVELANPRAMEIVGPSVEVGRSLVRGGSGADSFGRIVAELWRSPDAEPAAEVEIDGRILRLKLRRLAGGDRGGGAVVAVEDMTSEVRTARVLAWGEMARQVAHEIKNPLTPIKLAVQHVRRAYLDGRPDFGDILDRNVEAILREIDRLGEIARAFSRFGSPEAAAVELEPVDLRRAITDTLALYGGQGENGRFRVELPQSPLEPVVARQAELKEVLVNLLENAREASDEGDPIIVTAGQHPGEAGVFFAVSDTGSGIPAEQIPRIFEPHFSTRSSGTGLGLAIVRRIVDSWGGEIRVDSTVGEGTRIEILLQPASSQASLPGSGRGE